MSGGDFDRALEALVRAETSEAVGRGRAVVEVHEVRSASDVGRFIAVAPARDSAWRVTLIAQSDAEVSFFVGPPAAPGTMTVNLWDRDRREAAGGGRGVSPSRAGGPHRGRGARRLVGRVTFVLGDGTRAAHDYNALRRSRRWTLHRFDPY